MCPPTRGGRQEADIGLQPAHRYALLYAVAATERMPLSQSSPCPADHTGTAFLAVTASPFTVARRHASAFCFCVCVRCPPSLCFPCASILAPHRRIGAALPRHLIPVLSASPLPLFATRFSSLLVIEPSWRALQERELAGLSRAGVGLNAPGSGAYSTPIEGLLHGSSIGFSTSGQPDSGRVGHRGLS